MTEFSRDLTELHHLVQRLRIAPKLVEMGQVLGPEGSDELATEVSVGLLDIRKASDRLFNELLPRLLQLEPTGNEFSDVLHAIGEEYRHIYYHVRNTRLFDYVIPDP